MSLVRRWYNKFRNYFSGNWPVLYGLCEKRKSVIKFIISGGTAAAVDLVLLYIFYDLLLWKIVLASSVAFILAFLVSFSLQKFWTFRDNSQDRIFGQFIVYMLNALLGLYLNGLFIHLLVNRYDVWYILAQIIINLLLGFWNFIVFRFLIFNISKNETQS